MGKGKIVFFCVVGVRRGGRGGGSARGPRAVRAARRRAGLPAEPAAAVQRRAAALDHRALGQGQPGLRLPPRLQEVPQRWVLVTSLNTLFHVFRDFSHSQNHNQHRFSSDLPPFHIQALIPVRAR